MALVTGYLSERYAQALSEFGKPRFLPASRGWILERSIANSPYRDAMGCYPIFACEDWMGLESDLNGVADELVCLTVVTDPFGNYEPSWLRKCFGDLMTVFKEHFVVDLKRPVESFVHPHHQRNARKALGSVRVAVCAEPLDFLDDWNALYEALVQRHGITGIAAFSKGTFAAQLAVPGLVAFRAAVDDTTVGMLLWYVQGNVAYYHLGAYSARGYDLRVSFALFSYSMEYFARHGCEWLSLGAGAGLGANGESGLSRFKQGWSSGVRPAYLCGRIFDQQKYKELSKAARAPTTGYFPAYRAGEFG
jgi:Acetyltransferase (GNAT) domain